MHSKMLFAGLLAALMIVVMSPDAAAQRRDRDKERRREQDRRRESSTFVDHLWWGGGLNLGFSSFNNQSIFGIGVAPMVGYKIWEPLSVGPRVSFFYSSYKEAGFKALSLFDVDAGVFVRGRVYRGFFLQGEVSNSWLQQPYEYQSNNTISKRTIQRANQRLGAGYNWGNGGVGSEIAILYNFAIANDLETNASPLEYRFAITWRF